MTSYDQRAEDLVSGWQRAIQRHEKRALVEQHLVDLSRAQKLRLTPYLQLGGMLADLVGEVLLGHALFDGAQQRGLTVPDELQRYSVAIESISDEPVKDDRGQPVVDDVRTEVRGADGNPLLDGAGNPIIKIAAKPRMQPWRIRYKLPATPSAERFVGRMGSTSELARYVDNVVETNQTKVTLSAPHAWWCLRQTGEHCRPAKRRAVQLQLWKCREVAPSPTVTTEPPPDPGPRRRRNGLKEMHHAA